MTDAKPDPLEDLRQLARELESATCATDAERIDAAIAALEKERADTAHDIAQWQRVVTLHNEAITAIRAAVGKVRDELRTAYVPTVAGFGNRPAKFKEWADALDAALGGGV